MYIGPAAQALLQEVELTRRGKPVAVVMSLRELERLRNDRPRFSDAYRKFFEKQSLREVALDPEVFEATRSREQGRKVSM